MLLKIKNGIVSYVSCYSDMPEEAYYSGNLYMARCNNEIYIEYYLPTHFISDLEANYLMRRSHIISEDYWNNVGIIKYEALTVISITARSHVNLLFFSNTNQQGALQ